MDLDKLLQLMGLAIYNSTILDIRFPPCCYKKLLSSAPGNKFTSTNRESHGKMTEDGGQEMLPSNHALELTLNDLTEIMPVSIYYNSTHTYTCHEYHFE